MGGQWVGMRSSINYEAARCRYVQGAGRIFVVKTLGVLKLNNGMC